MPVRVRVRACVRVRVRARACVHVLARACVHVRARARACVRAIGNCAYPRSRALTDKSNRVNRIAIALQDS